MKTINWSGYEWITQERWGNIHPDKTVSWYDETAVEVAYSSVIECDQLILKTHKNPQYFKKLEVESPIGVGLISCKKKFGYGYYEIEAKLPSAPSLWPAFWTWAWESWPPEVDIFEAYSNKRGSYFNWNIDALWGNFYKVQTNHHLGKQPDKYSLGAKNHWIGWKRPDKRFNKYAMLWTKNEILIFYNDKMIRKVDDPEVLKQWEGKTMNVIINNGVRADIDIKNFKDSEMIVNYFKFTPYETLNKS